MKIITIRQKTDLKKLSCHRLLLALVFMFCATGFMRAQQQKEEEVYVYEQAPDEYRGQWFAGIGGGPRLFIADHARQLALRERISGGTDIYIGKWWGPVVGTRLGTSWQILRGATKYNIDGKIANGADRGVYSHAIDRGLYDPVNGLYRQQFTVYHVYGDLMFNASNFFGGVNEDRIVSAMPFVGVGYLSTYDKPSAHALTVNVGLLTTFRIAKNLDFTLDIRGAAFEEKFKNPMRDPLIIEPDPNNNWNRLNLDVGYRPYDGILSVNVGLQFRWGGGPSKPRPVLYRSEPVSPVPPPAPIVETETQVVTEWLDVAADVLILFKINETTLLDDAKVKLNFLGKLMQQYPESSYTITGYADAATGNPEINYRLSVGRSKRVKDYLVKVCGIPESRLQTDAAGGVPNQFYNDPSLSRSVIIRPNIERLK